MLFGLRHQPIRTSAPELFSDQGKELVRQNTNQERRQELHVGVGAKDYVDYPTQHGHGKNPNSNVAIGLWLKIAAGIAARNELEAKEVGPKKSEGQGRVLRGQR